MVPKLVWDKVPELIRAEGRIPVVRRLDPDDRPEVILWLRAKLQEEALEYLATSDPDEIGDIIAVCCELWFAATNLGDDGLLASLRDKNDAKGAFDDLVVLEGIAELVVAPQDPTAVTPILDTIGWEGK